MDEEQLANMLSNPNVMQQMNEMMNNDAFLDMMIQQNPMLRNTPNAREILRSPMMRHMMTNPDAIRSAARMRRAMGGGGAQNAFPMPGETDNNPNAAAGNNGAAGAPGAEGQQPLGQSIEAGGQFPQGGNGVGSPSAAPTEGGAKTTLW